METQDFLNSHSLHLLEMAYERGYMERLENPDGYGTRTGECGDSVEFFVMLDNKGCLSSISFGVNGCIYTIACCNTVIRMAQGKPLDLAWQITPDQVAQFLETLPEDHYHCAELAVGGFYLALADCQHQ